MTKLRFLKELMLIKQANQKNVIFFHYRYFLDKGFKFQPDVCNMCHNVLMMSMDLKDTASLNIHGADYRCIIS